MITLTDVISAYSTLEGKIYPNINVWYGPYDSLNSAIQYIENICTQIGRSKVKGITVAVEENGTLVEYWNPTNANIFIKKHDTSIIDPATTTSTPRPNKKMCIRNSSDSISLALSGGKIIDSSSSVILAGGNLEMSYIDKFTPLYIEGYGTSIDNISSIRIIDDKGGTILVEETSSAGAFRTTSSLYSLIEENDIAFIDIEVTKQVDTSITTTTTTTTTSTLPASNITKVNNKTNIPIEIIPGNHLGITTFIGTIPVDGVVGFDSILWRDTIDIIFGRKLVVGSELPKNFRIVAYTENGSYIEVPYNLNDQGDSHYLYLAIKIDISPIIENTNIKSIYVYGTFLNYSTTSSTTTSTKPSNIVYYGVIKGYMDPNSFCSIPINKLIDRSETKFKPIIEDSVNEFTIPQDGYFSYLIIPVDKVELQYAAFTSGGLTSTYYDSSKPNTPTALDPTPNGAYYSKYTRGGTAPYNKGGSYKGIDYDVYFAYINSGSIPEMINIKAKNK